MRITQRAGIVGIALILVLFGGFWAWSHDVEAPETPAPIATSTPEQTSETPSVFVRSSEETVALKSAEVRGTATFIVSGTSYQLTAPQGSTLKDAMNRLEMESSFTYSYKEYSGLGAFVTSINNRASTGDMVWILYVNGEKSASGISSTRIRSGDVIEWKLEESY